MPEVNVDVPEGLSATVLSIRSGDVVVLRYPGRVPASLISYLEEKLSPVLERLGAKAIVLEDGADIVVLRKDQADAPA